MVFDNNRFKFPEAYMEIQRDYEDKGLYGLVLRKGRWDLVELYMEYRGLKVKSIKKHLKEVKHDN